MKQYYSYSGITIYHGDCVEVMQTLPDGVVDLVVTSPPYDNLRTYDIGHTFEFPAVASELTRILKPGGVIVWIVGDATINGSETGTSFRQALHFKELGLNLHDTMIYEKINYIPLTHNRYEQAFEYMFVLSKGRPLVFNSIMVSAKGMMGGSKSGWYNPDGTTRGRNQKRERRPAVTKVSPNIFRYVVGKEKTGHPAVFPIQLACDHIMSWSNPGNLVFDPFLGSGTTAAACIMLGRSCIGADISEKYCEIATKRLNTVAAGAVNADVQSVGQNRSHYHVQ